MSTAPRRQDTVSFFDILTSGILDVDIETSRDQNKDLRVVGAAVGVVVGCR
jgi:hypothetical protein